MLPIGPVAALLDRRESVATLRRALPGKPQRVLIARDSGHLDRLLRERRIEAVVLGSEAVQGGAFAALRDEFSAMPVFCLLPAHPDRSDRLRRVQRAGAVLLVEGLDEPILERELARHAMTARRLDALLPMAARLDLVDELQLRAWELLVELAPSNLDTSRLARLMGVRRETLSRRFGAGGAPKLQRALAALRLVAAGQLLANRGLGVTEVARLLGYSSPSLLQRSARRLAAASARGLAALPPELIVTRSLGSGASHWG